MWLTHGLFLQPQLKNVWWSPVLATMNFHIQASVVTPAFLQSVTCLGEEWRVPHWECVEETTKPSWQVVAQFYVCMSSWRLEGKAPCSCLMTSPLLSISVPKACPPRKPRFVSLTPQVHWTFLGSLALMQPGSSLTESWGSHGLTSFISCLPWNILLHCLMSSDLKIVVSDILSRSSGSLKQGDKSSAY